MLVWADLIQQAVGVFSKHQGPDHRAVGRGSRNGSHFQRLVFVQLRLQRLLEQLLAPFSDRQLHVFTSCIPVSANLPWATHGTRSFLSTIQQGYVRLSSSPMFCSLSKVSPILCPIEPCPEVVQHGCAQGCRGVGGPTRVYSLPAHFPVKQERRMQRKSERSSKRIQCWSIRHGEAAERWTCCGEIYLCRCLQRCPRDYPEPSRVRWGTDLSTLGTKNLVILQLSVHHPTFFLPGYQHDYFLFFS